MQMKSKWKDYIAQPHDILYKRIRFCDQPQKKACHWTLLETRKIIITECQEKHMKITKGMTGESESSCFLNEGLPADLKHQFWSLTLPLYQDLHQMLLWNIQWTEILITRYCNLKKNEIKKKLQHHVFCLLFHSSQWDSFHQFPGVVPGLKKPW